MAGSQCEVSLLSVTVLRHIARPVALASTLVLAACSSVGDIIGSEDVKPWQRGVLARDDMQLIPDVLEQTVDDHIYFSREASTGGASVQGGGCGCN